MNPCWTPFLISSSVLHQNDLIGSFWSVLAKNNWSCIWGKNSSYIYFEQAIMFLIKQLYLACLNEQCNYTQNWNQLSRCLCLAWNHYSINPVMGFLRAVIRISNRSCTVLSFHCYLCLPGLDSESLKPVTLSGWPFLLNHLILPRTCRWTSSLKKKWVLGLNSYHCLSLISTAVTTYYSNYYYSDRNESTRPFIYFS